MENENSQLANLASSNELHIRKFTFSWKDGFFLYVYIAIIFILINYLPHSVSIYYETRSAVIALGFLGLWRYSWWCLHVMRSLIYAHIVFPIRRKKADQLWVSGWRPQQLFFMMTTFKEKKDTTIKVLESIVAEVVAVSVSAKLFIGIGSDEDALIIKEFFSNCEHKSLIEVILVLQKFPGKRFAIGETLRAIVKSGLTENDAVIFMDGDTYLVNGCLQKCLPFFCLFPKLQALTTYEKAIVYDAPNWMKKWLAMRFVQRDFTMCSYSLSNKVLTLTGRMSIFRGKHLLEPEFIQIIEQDKLRHWLWGEYRFLSGDDKSTWYYLLKEKADMIYVPDATSITIEYISGNAFDRMKENLKRWREITMKHIDRKKPLTKKQHIAKSIAMISMAQFMLCNPTFALATKAADDLGMLLDLKTVKEQGDHTYKFRIPYDTTVSIFLNGLSAGYKIELQDGQGQTLATAANRGTRWNSPTDSGSNDGSIVKALKGGYYFVHVSYTDVLGDDVYRSKDKAFTLNFIPDLAPNTIVISASNSAFVGNPKLVATGKHDNKMINQAIKWVGNLGGGRVLLRPGTYHINNNIKAIYDNVTIMGTGWGTILRLEDDAKLEGAGLLRSRYMDNAQNNVKDHFNNQHFMHMVLDGNKGRNSYFVTGVGNYGTYVNSSFEDLRVHDFQRYGLDPHESVYENTPISIPTSNLTIKDSLIDHNNQDGIIFEKTNTSTIVDNIVDSNGRHGINIVAESNNNTIKNNEVTANGDNGVTIQPGSDLYKFSNDNIIMQNNIKRNEKNGVYLYRTSGTKVSKNSIDYNGWYGVHIRTSSNNTVNENTFEDNSRVNMGEYAGINMSGDTTGNSTYNVIIKNYLHTSSLTTYKFGIMEHSVEEDYNLVEANILQNIMKPIRLLGAHSIAKDNEIL